MSLPNIETGIDHKNITTPFQLLAVWFTALVLLVFTFTWASTQNFDNYYLQIFYAFAAVIIIPIFLISIFKLQTQYRLEMLSDKPYEIIRLAQIYTKELKSGNTIPYNRRKK